MRSYEFIVNEAATALVGKPRHNFKELVPGIVKKSLPKLFNIKTIPGVADVVFLGQAAYDLWKGDYTNAALDAAMIFTPTPVTLALVATQIINDSYSELFADINDKPASMVTDLANDPKKYWNNMDYMKDYFIDYLQELLAVGKEKLNGKQAQQNFRATQVGMDTPNNPDPRKHPERYPTQ